MMRHVQTQRTDHGTSWDDAGQAPQTLRTLDCLRPATSSEEDFADQREVPLIVMEIR